MIASIVYATDQGLGRLAKDFYDNGIIDKVFIQHHSRRMNHYEWFPNRTESLPELLDDADALFCFETFFHWQATDYARRRGIKRVLMPMYECSLDADLKAADLILNPSGLDQQYFPSGVQVPVPVSVPYRERKTAEVFVHNAGHGGLGGRNGTKELLEAMQYVKSPIRLIVRSQTEEFTSNDPRVEFRLGTVPFEELYREGDVFIFPEKFNGLSLPLQEAFASGMLVMAPDRFPNTEYLPKEPLIPVEGYTKEYISRSFESAIINPKVIAKTIDQWYQQPIHEFSKLGKQYAQKMTWKKLKPKYTKNLLS